MDDDSAIWEEWCVVLYATEINKEPNTNHFESNVCPCDSATHQTLLLNLRAKKYGVTHAHNFSSLEFQDVVKISAYSTPKTVYFIK